MQPPASLKALDDPIYEAFYGLTEQPFAITTDPRFFYLSASHQRAFSELLNGLRRREGVLMVTGETGSGKTTLCRAVLSALGDRTFSALILNPYMTGAEVLRIVLRDFGLVSHDELRRGGLAAADVPQLLDTLEGFLRSLVPLGSHAVIVLDEAQSLVPAALDQIRLLTGLEHDGKRLVQVVLCGQPNLLQTIKTDLLLALNERITRRVELTALPADEIHGYIQHRLGVAGGTDAVRFDTAATQAVADLSRGLPRRINVLCDRALQEGRIEGVNVITADLVKRAARALAGVHDPLPVLPGESARTVQPAAGLAATPAPAPAAPVRSQPVVAPEPPLSFSTPPPTEAVEPPVATPAPVDVPESIAAAVDDVADATSKEELPDTAEPVVTSSPTSLSSPPELPAAEPVASSTLESLTPDRHDVGPSEAATSPAVEVAEPPAVVLGRALQATPALAESPSTTLPLAIETHTSDFLPERDVSAQQVAASRELSFGLEKPRKRQPARTLVLVALGVIAAAGLAYAAWTWDTRSAHHVVTDVPAAPQLDRGEPPASIATPPIDEVPTLVPLRRYVPPAPAEPVFDTPSSALAPSEPVAPVLPPSAPVQDPP